MDRVNGTWFLPNVGGGRENHGSRGQSCFPEVHLSSTETVEEYLPATRKTWKTLEKAYIQEWMSTG